VVVLGRAAFELVSNLFDPARIPRRRVTHKRALPIQLVDQVVGDMAELGGEILVDVQDVHRIRILQEANPHSTVYCNR
jgi:hypothetical protein